MEQKIQDLLDQDEYLKADNLLQLAIDKGYIKLRWLFQKAIDETNMLLVELLLHRMDPNKQLPNHEYPLNLAIRNESLEMVHLLLNHGANPNIIIYKKDIPLVHATNRGNIEIVEELLRYGADPNMISRDEVPLSLLRRGNPNRFEIANMLIDAGADLAVQYQSGMDLLEQYADKGDYDMVEYLLKKGLNPNHRNNRGKTVLLSVLDFNPTPELIQLLIDYGTDPRIPDNWGNTAFTFVSERTSRSFPLKDQIMDILESFEEVSIKEPGYD